MAVIRTRESSQSDKVPTLNAFLRVHYSLSYSVRFTLTCTPFRARQRHRTRCRVSEHLSNCRCTVTITRIFSKTSRALCIRTWPRHGAPSTWYQVNCISGTWSARAPCPFKCATIPSRRYSSAGYTGVSVQQLLQSVSGERKKTFLSGGGGRFKKKENIPIKFFGRVIYFLKLSWYFGKREVNTLNLPLRSPLQFVHHRHLLIAFSETSAPQTAQTGTASSASSATFEMTKGQMLRITG